MRRPQENKDEKTGWGGARKKDKRTLDIYKKKKKVVILSTRNKDLEMPMAGRQRGYCKNIFISK